MSNYETDTLCKDFLDSQHKESKKVGNALSRKKCEFWWKYETDIFCGYKGNTSDSSNASDF